MRAAREAATTLAGLDALVDDPESSENGTDATDTSDAST